MTTFLTYLVIILGIVALAQLIKVFELTTALKGASDDEVPTRDNKMNGTLMLLFYIALMISYVYLLVEYKDEFLPVAAAEHGGLYDSLMFWNMVIISIVFVLVNGVLFYFAYKYYGRKDREVVFFAHSNKLEMIWTVVPSIVLAGIIIFGLKTWNEITTPAGEDAMVVELYAKQFDFTARYAGKDNKLGDADIRRIDGANFLGLDSTDANSADDIIVKGEFHLPVGEEVNFLMRSQDVIHGAYMPHFRSQMNMVPGMVTQWHMKPTITTKEMREITGNPEFNYILLCNKICGASHYNMQMTIVVESPEEYNKWLSEQPQFLAKEKSAKLIVDNK